MKKTRTEKSDPSTSIFDIQRLTQLLLIYKFKSKDEINSINQVLGNSLSSYFCPIFSYYSNENDLEEEENDKF